MKVLLLSVLTSFLIAQAISALTYPILSYSITILFIHDRIQDMIEAIDKIKPQANSAVAVWGTSEIEGFVNPKLISEVLSTPEHEVQVYNLGIRSMHPNHFLKLAQAWSEKLTPTDTKFKLSVIKIPLTRLTKRFKEYNDTVDTKSVDAFFLKSEDLPSEFIKHPETTTDLFIEKYCFSKYSSTLTSYLFENLLNRYLVKIRNVDLSYLYFMAAWRWDKFRESPEWDIKKNGYYNWNLPKSLTLYNEVLRQKKKENVKAWGIRHFEEVSGILSLDWSDELVQKMIATIHEIEKISDKVVVLILPDGPYLQAQQNISAVSNTENLFKKIRENGINIHYIKNSDLHLTPNEYTDFLHISEDGWVKTFIYLRDSKIIELN